MTDQVTTPPAGTTPPATPPAGEATPPVGTPPPGEATPPENAPGTPPKQTSSPSGEPGATPETPDWREIMSGGDEGVKKTLEPFTDPAGMIKALKDSQTAARQRLDGYTKVPGEKATEEEIAAWNKAMGRPDEVSGYKIIEAPEGLPYAEQDTAFMNAQMAKMHEAGGVLSNPVVVEHFQNLYNEARLESAANMAAAAAQIQQQTQAELKQAWGADMEINMSIANNTVRAFFGINEDTPDDQNPMKWQLADGTRLGDHAQFIRAMASIGRNTNDDFAFTRTLNNEAGISNDDIQSEINSIMQLRSTDMKAYEDKSKPGGRLEELYAMQQRRAASRAA